MKYLDLSHTINTMTAVYPGDPAVQLQPACTYKTDGCLDHILTTGTHVGTHIDAPSHLLPGGKGMARYPVTTFIGQAICIDARQGFTLQSVEKAAITSDHILLFCTGASERFSDPDYYINYPVMSRKVVEYLIAKKPKMIGIDAGSVDNQDDFPVHKNLLAADILIIENLTNLQQLIGQKFELFALPIKLEKDGAPARVVARII